MSQVTVAYFATSDTALGTSLAGAEGREVIVKQEALLALVEHIVNNLFVVGGTQGAGYQSLRLATGKDGCSVRAGQIIHLAPDGTYLGGFAAVETDALVKHTAAHGLFLHIVIIALHHGNALILVVPLQLLLGEFGHLLNVFVADSLKLVGTPVFVGVALAGYGVSFVVAFGMNVGAQSVVVYLVVVFTFLLVAAFAHQLFLHLALLLDGVVSYFESFEELSLAHLVHFAFHHHDVVEGGANHQFYVGAFHLSERGVDDPFAVNASHTHLRDRSVERYVAAGQSGRGCQTCKSVGSIILVGRVESYIYKRLGVIIVGEKGAKHAVNKARRQYLVI